MNEETYYWLALSLIPGVGSIFFKRFLERFNTPEAVFRAPKKELFNVEGIGEKVVEAILSGPPEKRVKREFNLLKEVGGTLLTLKDAAYPRRLRDIYDPPPLLYLRGELKKQDDFALSIVGSRRTSPYGRGITEKISRDLVRSGITIVSGMARGIDAVAHWGALSEGGRTIAVLGCGVDIIYPSENRNLFTKII